MLARRFFYVSLGILALSIAYHLGTGNVDAEGHLEERFAPVLFEGIDTVSPVLGWLDRETGCFTLAGIGICGPGRRGFAPVGTRYVTFRRGGNDAVLAYANDGTYSYALFFGCSSPDTLDIGAWIGPSPIGVCYDPTSVRSGFDGEALAKRRTLSSPRPNPFNPSTEIAFTLDTAAPVELRIYDSSGALVRTLVDQPQAAGNHAVEWNGADDRGRPVASGTYFYQLRVNGDVEGSQKAVILR